MSDKLIRSLFEGRLGTWAAARVPALPVAWENVSFTPPAGAYLRAFLLRGATTSRDLAGDNRNRVGVFQISIVCPAGNGAGAAESIAAELDALFPMNLRLTSGTFAVQQLSPLRLWSPDSSDRYLLPVDFQYRADTYPT
ncbi:phage tail terminator-like protein [Variovorax ginsengisoli]|uniref:Phage tail terminator-like protein n=1 Tax=Variovorax ginsengisoli TaxID=363844 RepID=A0ABT8S1W7_9BURK|nr:phage tail terminator-like protein [Variovorax ginsengisoli]MDN8612797.1 phage tail terminator-like protein [Variovorax ginsengisoli]MDO1531967.1 phage tail terminator-like protein [Variovorax ginsengisoli]